MVADTGPVDTALEAAWPDAACELQASDPWWFLVAVICSAQTSDTRVNQVVAVLCENLAGPADVLALPLPDLERALARLPLFRQKARAIHESARHVVHHHQGRVPTDAEDLRQLPGVGDKTAAVVLGNCFGIPALAIDRHVARVVARLGWIGAGDDHRATANALARRFPAERWVRLCHQLIRLGRGSCRPKRPRCDSCVVTRVCPRVGVTDPR